MRGRSAPPFRSRLVFRPSISIRARSTPMRWKIDEPLTVRPTSQIEYPTVNRRLKGDRLPFAEPEPQAQTQQTLPQLESIGAPPPLAAPAAVPLPARRRRRAHPAVEATPEAAAPAFAATAEPSVPQPPAPPAATAGLDDDLAPVADAAPRIDAAAAAAPQAAAEAESRPVAATAVPQVLPEMHAQRGCDGSAAGVRAAAGACRRRRRRTGSRGHDAAPSPPNAAPAAPPTTTWRSTTSRRNCRRRGEAEAADAAVARSTLSFLDEDRAIAARRSISAAASWARRRASSAGRPGAEPILVAPAADSDIKLSALEGTDSRDAAAKRWPARTTAALESPANRLGLAGKPRVQAENVWPMRSISKRAAR